MYLNYKIMIKNCVISKNIIQDIDINFKIGQNIKRL